MTSTEIDSRPHGLPPLPADTLAEQLGARLVGDAAQLTGATIDSRAVRPGDLWIAVQGENNHGAEFAAGAVELGCGAILTDTAGEQLIRESIAADRIPALLLSEDPRAHAARAADLIYAEPSASMSVVGVTGTNGKTSITTMIDRTLQSMGVGTAVVGTNGTFVTPAGEGTRTVPTVRTTPEAPDLHGMLAMMRESGVQTASLEVSSHAMILHRADSVRFACAVFTNLSQDHLDFHGTMEAYFDAKAMLFAGDRARSGVICVDDDWGRRLADRAEIPSVTYTTDPDREADFRVTSMTPEGFGTRFTVAWDGGDDFDLVATLPGTHYVANTLGVALALHSCGYDFDVVAEHVATAGTVPGRMELVHDDGIRAVVDYSHTPDALEKTLVSLRALPNVRRILTVMGAGGDRDRAKRPLMGEVAARLSDTVVITDDNPRTEDPASIREQVAAGAYRAAEQSGADVIDQGDRAEAIARALRLAEVGDVVIVAGKGAETGQDFGDRVIDFDDRAHVRAHFTRKDQDSTHA